MQVLSVPLRALLFCFDFFFGKVAHRNSNFSALLKYKIQDVTLSSCTFVLLLTLSSCFRRCLTLSSLLFLRNHLIVIKQCSILTRLVNIDDIPTS